MKEAPTEAAFGLAFLLRMHTPHAGYNIGRGIGYIEEDDDLPAWLALESATMFLHGLVAGWAPRCHRVMGTPETANSFSRAQDMIAARYMTAGYRRPSPQDSFSAVAGGRTASETKTHQRRS
jgi:hypothetical protein